jgi:hypothetical protein
MNDTIFLSVVSPGEKNKVCKISIEEYQELLLRYNLDFSTDVKELLSTNGIYYYILNNFANKKVCVFVISENLDKIQTLTSGIALGFEADIYSRKYIRDKQNLN